MSSAKTPQAIAIPLVRVHGVDDVRLDSVDMPDIGAGDVLVEVSLCGICGSDLGYVAMGGLGMTQPMPLGHELVGTIVQAGDRVDNLAPGDRVVVNPMAANNSIGNGGTEGAFTSHLAVRGVADDPTAILKVPDKLGQEQAALIEPLSVALHGCHQGRAQASDKAVVFGAGPIGLCTAICLGYLGLENIIVVDNSEHRLNAAHRIGAKTFKASSGKLSDFLREQHGEAVLMGTPVPDTDLYIEATGAKAVFEQIVTTAKTGARAVVLGLHKQPVTLDLANLLLRELQITGSMAYPQEFPEVINMLASGNIDVTPVISHHFPLSQFTEALTKARDTESAIKVLVDCQA
jgi:(R,R)-butanediol dehydrogenase / meso-butanediol dehydrogenase / diacetyl reductase